MISMGLHQVKRLRLEKRTSINSHSHFHKEKEMADFRKWLFAFAVVALMLGGAMANAQAPSTSAFTCVANAGNPVIVRSEGITELVGDLLLQCTGGNPTVAGQQIPVSNVTLTLNTNITSRLLGSTGYIDALLLIDEPFPTTVNALGTINRPTNSPAQVMCEASSSPASTSACNYLAGTGGGAYGSTTSPYVQAGASTVYVARQAAANQVTWLGVPIDAPGTTGQRIVRLTNVRANACQLGLSSTLIPTQIVGFVAINGSQFITINNPQQTLAYIQQGLVTSAAGGSGAQCNNLNTGFFGSSGGVAEFSVRVTEGFAASFKRAVYTGTAPIGALTGSSSANAQAQNVPGFAYNTESALQPDNPTSVTAPTNGFGRADTGTRILLRFNNVGSGVRLFLPAIVALATGSSSAGNPTPPSNLASGSYTGGFLQLIGAGDLNGNAGTGPATTSTTFASPYYNGSTFSSSPFRGPLGSSAPFAAAAEVSITGGVGTAVYEVVNSDPAALESGNIPVGVGFTSNTASNVPTPGSMTVHASFAPLSTVGTADSSAPIPRFCDQSSDLTIFKVNICQCQLLFPFVTQAPGFDTGIAIANTSLDTYNGLTPQTGAITLYFYGQEAGGAAVPTSLASMTTTGSLPAGQVATYTLFSGAGSNAAGWQANPGFTGYIIAVSNFQWCHGFAFISDLGAQKLAEGYLAIQLDQGGLNRTPNLSENKAH
jgi:hypothetical protein